MIHTLNSSSSSAPTASNDPSQPPSSSPSFTDRIKAYFLGIPIFTRCIFIFCISLFVIQCIFDWPKLQTFCFNYILISRYPLSQFYRMVTYFVFHLNGFHIVFNMMALMSLGYMLEVKLGTIHLIYSTVIIAFLSALFQFAIEGTLFDLIQWSSFSPACLAGYSGILFAYCVLSAYYEPWDRSLFGAFSISAQLYPWLLLLITSLLFPGVSFLGHLCGMLAAYAFIPLLMNRSFYKQVVKATERKLPSVVTGMNSFYLSSIPDDFQQQSLSSSLTLLSQKFTAIKQWIIERYQAIRNRINGGTSYSVLGSSPVDEEANDSVGGNQNNNGGYWDNAGQGRTLGAV